MKDQIAAALAHITGNSIVGISAETPVTLKGGKKNPLQGKVYKRLHSGNVMIFCNRESNGYENMVKRRLIKEGMDAENFQLGNRAWGTRIPASPFVFHKGSLYLETIFLKKPAKIEYIVDGQVTPKELIEGLPDGREEGEQGGLINKVIIRTYNTENITAIRIDGKEFIFNKK